MSISGLVVTLAETPAPAEAALEMLGADGRLRVGVRSGRRVAVVAETDSAAADREVVEDLLRHPGVTAADIVFVEIEEPTAVPPPGPSLSNPGDRPS